jgi:hypothetical protein
MKRIFLPIIILLSMLFIFSASALLSQPAAASTEPPPGYVVARVYYTDQADLAQLATRLDVWEVDQKTGSFVAMLSPARLAELQNTGYRIEVDPSRTAMLYQPLIPEFGQISGIPGYPCYRTVTETLASIDTLLAEYPDLITSSDIGDSWEKATPGGLDGYDIIALRLTNFNFGDPDAKPTFFLMAEIHARELVTTETALRMAEHLLSNYGIDPDITWLLDYYQVYIVPLTNPDGRIIAETGVWWRKNTDNDDGCSDPDSWGVDLNRNHIYHWLGDGSSPYPCDITYRGPSAGSEPEVQAIQDFVRTIIPDQRPDDDITPAPDNTTGMFITLHSYSELVLWPWGWTSTNAPNHTQLQTLGRHMAYFNDYMPQQSVNLYPTNGTSDDWAYGELGVPAYTYEMGTEFFQDCPTYENTIYPDNLDALLYAFKAARQPYMDPSGPDSLNPMAQPAGAAPGEPIALTATADDTHFSSNGGVEPTQNITAARYSIDAPSWITGTVTYPLAASDGSFNSTVEAVEAVIDTTGLSFGRHTVFVESQDLSGKWGVPSAIFIYILDPAVSPHFEGYVTSADDGSPLDALVSAGIFSAYTDPATGYYNMTVISGTYNLTASADGYAPLTVEGLVANDYETIQQDFELYGYCTIFSDDVEAGNAGWDDGLYWGITSQYAHSPSNSWTDSPNRQYYNFMNDSLTSPVFDLTDYTGVSVNFWTRYDTEATYDYGYVEYWNGSAWVQVAAYDGQQSTWVNENLLLPGLDGNSQAQFRFRFYSDNYITADGWYIDDIVLQGGGPGCSPAPEYIYTYLPFVVR